MTKQSIMDCHGAFALAMTGWIATPKGLAMTSGIFISHCERSEAVYGLPRPKGLAMTREGRAITIIEKDVGFGVSYVMDCHGALLLAMTRGASNNYYRKRRRLWGGLFVDCHGAFALAMTREKMLAMTRKKDALTI